ncbi:ketopantoate reductase family protein [Mucilaginibacter lappiensis]|uniref:2-dehydropantoate 2-reductase n=1 Tax=Mucilaginibacter lappiensis TaxID=354630 RepID=A0A1N7D244_9SPHI|nr:2-dehydropantoate 2-reductase [Mucilaginibacter lappiensis]MBB6111127.1 2-dehydropantoate 2-reductase [Mucilaginibacter lappiensis]MBB6128749.1 2-dehydropantoate 2-reductase [Mucilaginibacter lappiensis]SIR69850.1 2-dehydropantoate 2-reductase [Mucilaginibacter lappiensis]
MNKTIFIVGNGAIGKALAVFLKLQGKNVVILRGSVDDGSSVMEKITVVLADQSTLEAEVEISTLSRFQILDGVVVLTNKSFGNDELALALKPKINTSPLVILQNGLGVEQVFTDHEFPGVYRCVLFVTSQVAADNRVSFKPAFECPIGGISGNNTSLNDIVEELSTPHFLFRAEENIQQVIWKKAIMNSVYNSVCPLLNVDNGIFHRNEQALAIACEIIAECVQIAHEAGVILESEDVIASLVGISKASDGQLISTLQDINRKLPTEIDTLNFAIVRIAEKFGKAHLVEQTRLLGELVKLKSDINR